MSWGVATRNAVGLGLAGIVSLVSRAVQQAVAVVDPFFNYVTLLLPGNGTNGAQNNTFVDSSTNAFTITRNGNTTQGTFSPFSQTGWSNYFDGSGDYIQVPAGAFAFSTGDYTFECFVNLSALPAGGSYSMLYDARSGATATNHYILIDSSGYLVFRNDGETTTTTQPLKVGVWTHIAQARSGTTLKTFVGGVEVNSKTSNDDLSIGSAVEIGYSSNDSNYALNGYVSNLRTVIGTPVYTAAFTPPTSPLTAISGTSLLTCQSNRFIDNSSNAFAITANGDVSVQAFSPFNPTAAWSAATYGGSGYFDGNGDQLGFASNAAFELGSGDFSYEAFVYATRLINTFGQGIISYGIPGNIGTSTCDLQINSLGYLQLAYATGAAATLTDTATFPLNQWVHVAVCRSGSTLSMFVNGTRKATASTSATVGTGGAMTIGGQWYANASNRQFQGYISDARVLKGTSAYDATQSSITAPTAPLTAITNTQLLTNFTNAGIYDATAKNDLETVGNAQISTTQSKFGGSSMYFDGTGDYLKTIEKPLFDFGAEDFTVEAWVYISDLSARRGIIGQNSGTAATNQFYMEVLTTGRLDLYVYYSSTFLLLSSATSAISTGAWNHVAAVRNGSDFDLYLNGTSVASTTTSITVNNSVTPLAVGAINSVGTYPMNGYLQDVRITKGIARYTGNFTPPTAAFPVQ